MTFPPIVGLRLGLLLNGRLGGECAAHFLVLGRVFVGLRLRVVVVVDAVHIVRIWDVEVKRKRFLCGHGMTHTEHKLQLAALWMLLTSEEHGENIRAEVHARHGVRVRPAQAFGQGETEARVSEVDDLLHFLIGRDGVGRPVERGDNLASLDANEIVPEFDAVAIVVLGDDEGAESSVDVECGFVFVHVYKIAQIMEKAMKIFSIF